MNKSKKKSKASDPGKVPNALSWRDLSIQFILSGLGGVGVFLAFPNFNLAPLAWITLVPELWAVRGTSGRTHFLLGWLAGSITNLGGFYWVAGLLKTFAHMSILPTFLLTLLLSVYQGIVFAFWLYLVYLCKKRTALGMWLIAPLCYVVVEFLVPFIFPWYFANSQYWVIPIIQVCELGGVTLLSFLLVMTNGLLFDALDRWRTKRDGAIKHLIAALSIPAVLLLYGIIRMAMVDAQLEKAPHVKIGLVEADVGIWEKEDPQKIDDNLVRHQRMSMELEKQGAQLIVWPESSYHAPRTYARRKGQDRIDVYRPIPRDVAFILPSELPPPEHALEDRISNTRLEDRVAPQRGFKTPLLFGAATAKSNPENRSENHPGRDIMNTAILLDEKGEVLGAYDKVYLLVFGEYIPLGETFPIFYRWVPEAGDFTPGRSVDVLPFLDYRIGVMICYEDILPRFTRDLARKDPHVFINVTNDAWFGKTAEPYLHLALSVFRSVEHRVALVRSTNTGVSAFVDPVGRILKQTRLTDPETLIESVPMMEAGTVYGLLGDWPAYISLLFLFWVLILNRFIQKIK